KYPPLPLIQLILPLIQLALSDLHLPLSLKHLCLFDTLLAFAVVQYPLPVPHLSLSLVQHAAPPIHALCAPVKRVLELVQHPLSCIQVPLALLQRLISLVEVSLSFNETEITLDECQVLFGELVFFRCEGVDFISSVSFILALVSLVIFSFNLCGGRRGRWDTKQLQHTASLRRSRARLRSSLPPNLTHISRLPPHRRTTNIPNTRRSIFMHTNPNTPNHTLCSNHTLRSDRIVHPPRTQPRPSHTRSSPTLPCPQR
ncbi:hypothetical protein BJ165DRAFT_1464103, partial [Panaeolus papilionaceus]